MAVQYSPILEYVTILGNISNPLEEVVTIDLLASVTTIGLDFEGTILGLWIRNYWHMEKTSLLTNFVTITSGNAYKNFAKLATTVDLHPSPWYTEQGKLIPDASCMLKTYLEDHPTGDTRGTLVYSSII